MEKARGLRLPVGTSHALTSWLLSSPVKQILKAAAPQGRQEMGSPRWGQAQEGRPCRCCRGYSRAQEQRSLGTPEGAVACEVTSTSPQGASPPPDSHSSPRGSRWHSQLILPVAAARVPAPGYFGMEE